VTLIVEGTAVGVAAGNGDYHLRRHTFYVGEHVGRAARLRVDSSGETQASFLFIDEVRGHRAQDFDPDRPASVSM